MFARILIVFTLLAAAAAAVAPAAHACSPAETPVPAYAAVCELGPDGVGVVAGAWTPDGAVAATGAAGCVGGPMPPLAAGCSRAGAGVGVWVLGESAFASAGAGPRGVVACAFAGGLPSPCDNLPVLPLP